MPQLTYKRNMDKGFAGMPYSSHISADVLTAINDDPRAQQVVEFEVADTETEGDLTINGVLVEGEGADQDEVAADLADKISEDPLLSGSVLAEAVDDTVTVTAKVGGIGFTFADGTNTTATETQANAQADPIPFGRAVLEDGQSEDDGELLCKLPDTADADAILGVAQYTATHEQERDTSVGSNFEVQRSEYPANSLVNVMRKGRIYVSVEDSPSIGDDVYIRHAADGDLDQLGAFASSSGTGLVEVEDARWHRGGEQGEAVLQLDFT